MRSIGAARGEPDHDKRHAPAKWSQPAIGFTTVYRALNRLSWLASFAEVGSRTDMTYWYRAARMQTFTVRAVGASRTSSIGSPAGGVERIAGSYGIHVREAAGDLSGRGPACRRVVPAP